MQLPHMYGTLRLSSFEQELTYASCDIEIFSPPQALLVHHHTLVSNGKFNRMFYGTPAFCTP